jgi:hypothetical protein
MVPRSTRDHAGFNNSQPSEGRLPFRIAAGPVLATLLFRAGGVYFFTLEVSTITSKSRIRVDAALPFYRAS